METLTKRQQQLLDFIRDHLATHGFPPSIREMAEHMGIRSTNGVNDHLKALERKGYLSRQANLKSRAISVLPRPAPAASRLANGGRDEHDILEVPLLGQVAAGAPILAEERPEANLGIDRSLLGGGGQIFALRVQGESMIDKGIFDGDTVFVRRQQQADAGQVVVVMIDGEATVKTFRPLADRLVFEPANPAMAPIEVHRSEFRQTDILGVVVGVFRRLS